MGERVADERSSSRRDAILVASWRITSNEYREAAKAAADPKVKRKLCENALRLALKAEALERTHRNRA
jgi:hypothetical protein